MPRGYDTLDGNEAAAHIAYRLSEVIAIYPITPSSPMGELSDAWAAGRRPNLWGTVPTVVELQSEAGVAGTLHGAVTMGALATTFTSSQGLLLMIPNMYKIAGELSPTVIHVASRALATHALSIFGDHSDVMAARATGFALLASNGVQEAMDLALVAHAASLRTRLPFLHFFDGFRTSHELTQIEVATEQHLRAMVPESLVRAHRARGLTPDRPVLAGTAQNPDVFFQSREASNPFYDDCAATVQAVMDDWGRLSGRQYHLFEYWGAPDADRVLVVMGSAGVTARKTVERLLEAGEPVGVVEVRLFRPFDAVAFRGALPPTVTKVAVLDRTKEPGALGEPLYLDVTAALAERRWFPADGSERPPCVVGGRYGLGSKELTPGMLKGVFDELARETPRRQFTVGISDDVTGRSVPTDPRFDAEPDTVFRAVFFGLGSDGTVSASKSTVKIIGEETDQYAQGFSVYDSRKSGTLTVSHVRIAPEPIEAPFLIRQAQFVACHQWQFVERHDVVRVAADHADLLLNSPYGREGTWDHLPRPVQEEIIAKGLRLWAIDAGALARAAGLGGYINTILQTAFFALTPFLPTNRALAAIKRAIAESYGDRCRDLVKRNCTAVDAVLEHLVAVPVPPRASSAIALPPVVPSEAPEFVQRVTAAMLAGRGDALPVSALPPDGRFPVGTTQWEKRNLASAIPVWHAATCIQCGKCALVCPHAAIRTKVLDQEALDDAPASFEVVACRGTEFAGRHYRVQVAPEDCTGCALCVEVCPPVIAGDSEPALAMRPQAPLRDAERRNYAFFLGLPEADRTQVRLDTVRGSQLAQPLFEYSGACAGCGETPYLKLLSQLFGDRALIANATGCSSIFSGNLPTTPWTTNRDGRGPAWCNSLFEDNAEFGYGFRLALDSFSREARALLGSLRNAVGDDLADAILNSPQRTEADLHAQRDRVAQLKRRLESWQTPPARRLMSLADYLVRKSVWIVGGDGWAFDIGFGGLDHVLASGADVNVLVLDTEVYSNTGGQMSKATPRGAVAKFAADGKALPKKDLAAIALLYRTVYVARVAMGANDTQTVRAFAEAEAYPGPSLILAYCHCIAHGFDLRFGLQQQAAAVASGYWPLFRFNPAAAPGHRFALDSRPPTLPFADYICREARYAALMERDPAHARELLQLAEADARATWERYASWAREEQAFDGAMPSETAGSPRHPARAQRPASGN